MTKVSDRAQSKQTELVMIAPKGDTLEGAWRRKARDECRATSTGPLLRRDSFMIGCIEPTY